MCTSITLIIHRGSVIFDSVIVTVPALIVGDSKKLEKRGSTVQEDSNSLSLRSDRNINSVCLNMKGYNAYFVSALVATLMISETFRRVVLKKLSDFQRCRFTDRIKVQTIFLRLRTPKKQFIDYKWNESIVQMILERREIDHAMSWLSTLGGAFSALGDNFQRCAEMAGKISVKQFKLALRVGDPLLIARCNLYTALSLIQQGQLRIAKKIVRLIYTFAIAQKDVRLQNMCQGIWAKLKYSYELRGEKKSTWNS